MRILAINDLASKGGAAQLYWRTNQLVRQAGHDVVELTGEAFNRPAASRRDGDSKSFDKEKSKSRRSVGFLRGYGSRFKYEIKRNIRHLYYPKLIRHLEKLCNRTSIDVAHIHNIHEYLSTGVFGFLKSRRIPVVYQINDYYFYCNTYYGYNGRLGEPCDRCIRRNMIWAIRYRCSAHPRKDPFLMGVFRRALLNVVDPWKNIDVYIVTGRKTGDLLTKWGVNPDRIAYGFNPMVLGAFDVPVKTGKEIVFYGSFLKLKGTDTFLRVLRNVKEGCHIGVYLVGMNSEYERQLKAVAKRRKLHLRCKPDIRWKNGLKEVIAREARAVIVPSQWWVTSENVVYESLLLGKPVIVSRMGGNEELILHAQTGYLCEPQDHKRFADYINLLSSDVGLAERLGRNARINAQRQFSETKFLDLIESTYSRARQFASKSTKTHKLSS